MKNYLFAAKYSFADVLAFLSISAVVNNISMWYWLLLIPWAIVSVAVNTYMEHVKKTQSDDQPQE